MSTPATHRGIIVGVDGSPAAKVAVDWAARDAAMRKVPLAVVSREIEKLDEVGVLKD